MYMHFKSKLGLGWDSMNPTLRNIVICLLYRLSSQTPSASLQLTSPYIILIISIVLLDPTNFIIFVNYRSRTTKRVMLWSNCAAKAAIESENINILLLKCLAWRNKTIMLGFGPDPEIRPNPQRCFKHVYRWSFQRALQPDSKFQPPPHFSRHFSFVREGAVFFMQFSNLLRGENIWSRPAIGDDKGDGRAGPGTNNEVPAGMRVPPDSDPNFPAVVKRCCVKVVCLPSEQGEPCAILPQMIVSETRSWRIKQTWQVIKVWLEST